MIKLKRQIMLTTCMVFLLPCISLAAENEHERYVPKEVLAKTKFNLEEQAKAIGGLVENVIDHVTSPKIHEVKAVRMVGPIVDFEKAAGIKKMARKMETHSDDHQVMKTEMMDKNDGASKVSEANPNAPHGVVGNIEGTAGHSLEKSESEPYKNVEMSAEMDDDSHADKSGSLEVEMHAKDSMHKDSMHNDNMNKDSAMSHDDEALAAEAMAEDAHDAEPMPEMVHDKNGHSSSSQKPEMFISILDEQRKKSMHKTGDEHGEAGHADNKMADKGHEEGDHGRAEGEDGEPKEHEFVFETIEVPVKFNAPTREIRALQLLQDRLVAGAPESFKLYRSQLIKAGKILKTVNPQSWQYKKNLDAVALFTLIGGDPRAGKIARSKTELSENHTLYLDAALAYSNGRMGEAYVLFKKIDFKHVPTSTAVQFAIVKSMLFGRHDAKLAKDYLNFAREFAPGTLAEEAALRRLIRMSSDEHDVKLFMRISSIYISRYKDSFYFNDFLKNYAYSLVRMPKNFEDEILANLKELFKSLKNNQQLALASYVSGVTTDTGMFKLSAWTAKSALSLSRKNGKLHTRMMLYHLASTVTKLGATDTMMEMIEGIDDAVLNTKDKQLYDSVIALSQRIYNDPMTQDQIKSGIKLEAHRFSEVDPTEKLFKDSEEYARGNVTIMKSVDILAKSDAVLKGSVL